MHIIFGKEKAETLAEKYPVLELDTFRLLPMNVISTAYAVVESVPIQDLPRLSFQTDLHKNLMENYRKRDWNFCEQAIENLVGNFNKELDSFYAEISNRIAKFKEHDPGQDWDPIITKTVLKPDS